MWRLALRRWPYVLRGAAVALAFSSMCGSASARPPLTGAFVYPSFAVSHYAPAIPWSGPISTVSTRSGDDSDIVVATDSLESPGTIFSSRDAGRTWVHDNGFPGDRVQAVTYDDDAGGWRCACLLATTASDYRTDGGGGLYETNDFFPPRTWTSVSGIFPSPGPTCPATPAAHDIAISPDRPHVIYVGTDCGIAILTPNPGSRPTVTTKVVTGAPDQHVESLIALAGGTLIVGGPTMGIWSSTDNGDHWTQSTGTTDAVGFIHAFARDPRGARAYALANDSADQLELFETGPINPGVSWTRIPITLAKIDSGCGGIPNVHAVEQGTALHLYAGDRCQILQATVPLSQEPDRFLSTGSWSALPAPHGDTRDLAFKSGTNTPYLETSDGGIARSDDGGHTFQEIGGPAAGLDANQVDEVAGQRQPGHTDPDLYFATWHNELWSMHGTTPRPAQDVSAEGFDIGMPRLPSPGAENKISITACDPCRNTVGGPYFSGIGPFSDAEQTPDHLPVGNPVFVSPGHYVQATNPSYRDGIAGYVMTGDDGRHWHRIAEFSGTATGFLRSAGPATDPTLFFPYVVRTHDDLATVGLATIKHPDLTSDTSSAAACSSSSHNCRTYQSMMNFGSLGITPTDTAGYPVLAVDPSDPSRLIAADTTNQDIRRSTNGGSSWTQISGLADQIDQHGTYHFALPAWGELSPNASVISICPEDGQRVLIGTRQGGAYFSYDGGSTFWPVGGSAPVRFATSIFWLPGCAAAYVGTWGRGIFRIDMALHTLILHSTPPRPPQHPCEPVVCRLEHDLAKRIDEPHPPPSAARGLLVTDGAITKIASHRRKTVIDVTAGATVIDVDGKLKRITIKRVAWRKMPARVLQAAFFAHGKLIRTLRGQELKLYPLTDTKPGTTQRKPPETPATISFPHSETLYGTAFANVPAGEPLSIQVTPTQPVNATLLLEIDGDEIAKYAPETKEINYSGDPAIEPGEHEVELVEADAKGTTTLTSAEFAVANGDGPGDGDKN
jgi:hypothetical protein